MSPIRDLNRKILPFKLNSNNELKNKFRSQSNGNVLEQSSKKEIALALAVNSFKNNPDLYLGDLSRNTQIYS